MKSIEVQATRFRASWLCSESLGWYKFYSLPQQFTLIPRHCEAHQQALRLHLQPGDRHQQDQLAEDQNDQRSEVDAAHQRYETAQRFQKGARQRVEKRRDGMIGTHP